MCLFIFIFATGNEPSISNFPVFRSIISPEERMAFLSAFNFIMLGAILFLFHRETETTSNIAHVLVIPVFLICYFTIISYILGVYDATSIDNSSVALNTGIAFILLCFAILLMRPDTWFMKLYMIHDTGGMIARILVIPCCDSCQFLQGYCGYSERKEDMLNSETGTVFETVMYTLCLIVIISLDCNLCQKN